MIGPGPSPFLDLQRATDLDSLWRSCVEAVSSVIPFRSCSLLYDIEDFTPRRARHSVSAAGNTSYVPATSLSVSSPFLERNPLVSVYTYTQIVSQDPLATVRRVEQEPNPEWDEFVHLAFWRYGKPDAVLSVHLAPGQASHAYGEGLPFLEHLYPTLDAGLQRLYALDRQAAKSDMMEEFVRSIPLPIMFVDADVQSVFCSNDAQRLAEQWNRNLPRAERETFQVPGNIANLLASSECSADGVAWLAHPRLKGLKLRIENISRSPSLHSKMWHQVTFVDDCVQVREHTPSQRALIALRAITPSERRIAQLVAQGLRNEEIAEKICRSRRTVESQIASIYGKLGLCNRAQLTRLLS